MEQLVSMVEDIGKILLFRKRVENDPTNTSKYEHGIWKLYSRITDHKKKYEERKG